MVGIVGARSSERLAERGQLSIDWTIVDHEIKVEGKFWAGAEIGSYFREFVIRRLMTASLISIATCYAPRWTKFGLNCVEIEGESFASDLRGLQLPPIGEQVSWKRPLPCPSQRPASLSRFPVAAAERAR